MRLWHVVQLICPKTYTLTCSTINLPKNLYMYLEIRLMGQSSLPFKQNAHNGLLLKQMFTLALLSPRQHTKYFFILFIFDFPKQPLSSPVLFVFFTFPNTELFSSSVMLPLLSACSFFFVKNPRPTSGPLRETLELQLHPICSLFPAFP